jgi:biopolymer transport protein ExbD
MADILSKHSQANKVGARQTKKLSTRVDLTPMVDLGFLLITFFIFTTSLTEPKTMSLNLPADGDSTKAIEGKVLNLMLGENDKVFYYYGDDVENISCTNFSAAGVRNVIFKMQKRVLLKYGNKHQTVVLIHPSKNCSYKNLVDILDEMLIADITKYVLMEEDQSIPSSIISPKQPC